jgi:hypothetical protein
MNRKNDHLNDCLERLLRGEDMESCLKYYPNEAEELRPLLEQALEIRRYSETAKLRPEFIAQTRANWKPLTNKRTLPKRLEHPEHSGLLAVLPRYLPLLLSDY